MIPTSAEFSRDLTPAVKSVLRSRRPMAGAFAWMPLVQVIIEIVLQIIAERQRRAGPVAAGPGGLPWADSPESIPEDVRRAAED